MLLWISLRRHSDLPPRPRGSDPLLDHSVQTTREGETIRLAGRRKQLGARAYMEPSSLPDGHRLGLLYGTR